MAAQQTTAPRREERESGREEKGNRFIRQIKFNFPNALAGKISRLKHFARCVVDQMSLKENTRLIIQI